MKIALVQHQASSSFANNVSRGLEAVKEAAENGAELVVFPELAFTHFFPQKRCQVDGEAAGLAEPVPGPTTDAFSAAAKENDVAVVLNLYEATPSGTFDSSPVIDNQGRLLGCARMMHIPQFEGYFEQDYYTPGDVLAPMFEVAGCRLGVAICYDRHFTEYTRALALAGADLVVVPQAGAQGIWPQGLFQAELKVTAFQNGYFMALANRVGQEEVLHFSGGSFVVDPFGQLVCEAELCQETILYAKVEIEKCHESPARTLFIKHRRPECYENGAVKI